MKIALGCDHAGYDLKEIIKEYLRTFSGVAVEDYGTFSKEPVDYPDVAAEVARAVSGGKADRGILMCGTGIGMEIAANKFPGVYAARCEDPVSAHLARAHNNANVLTFGGRTAGCEMAKAAVKAFLSDAFEGGRHGRRVKKIESWEVKPDQTANPYP